MNDQLVLNLACVIFLLPLACFALMAVFHERIPRHGDWLATTALGVTLACAIAIFVHAAMTGRNLLVNVTFDWLPLGMTNMLKGGILVDRLTAVMLVVVTLVSFLVHLFSVGYMAGDVRYGRYYCGLLLFTTSMLGLVLANNLIYLYIFWELVGLSSYLLIGHWFEKKSASDAAIKAFITTRLGDVGMFIGLMICYWKVGSLQYADLFAAVQNGVLSGQGFAGYDWQTLAGLGIFFGAMGKSAQFPLHVWLPDAMEGPTPVSALIHAATMVAAGVYLTGRLLPFFSPPTLIFIAYIGGITAIFAATIALVQDDIKKVLAYSTVSQLGYMIMALGVGGYVSGLFHLTTHAMFKACLFLGSGAVIHAMHHEQSMSQYGGLRHKMPWTATFYIMATLALCGVPPFAGFWSKDLILGDTLAFTMQHGHWFLVVAGFGTAFLTAFYMTRQVFLTFFGAPRNEHKFEHAHEVAWQMLLPLVILGTLSLVGGLGGWFEKYNPKLDGITQIKAIAEAGYQSPLVATAVAAAHQVAAAAHEGAEGAGEHNPVVAQAHHTAMVLSIVLAFAGIGLGVLMYRERKNGKALLNPDALARAFRPVYVLLWNKYFFDEIYNAVFVETTHIAARVCAVFDRLVIDSVVNFAGLMGKVGAFVVDMLDRLVVDGLMVNGSARAAGFMGNELSYAQTGRVRQYLLLMVLGILALSGVVLVLIK
ncbi:NADH-quinone oxidoreductase subunit L [bacterium]|nr:NADH-quinone oxidoreductase subunit L [bacterium]